MALLKDPTPEMFAPWRSDCVEHKTSPESSVFQAYWGAGQCATATYCNAARLPLQWCASLLQLGVRMREGEKAPALSEWVMNSSQAALSAGRPGQNCILLMGRKLSHRRCTAYTHA